MTLCTPNSAVLPRRRQDKSFGILVCSAYVRFFKKFLHEGKRFSGYTSMESCLIPYQSDTNHMSSRFLSCFVLLSLRVFKEAIIITGWDLNPRL